MPTPKPRRNRAIAEVTGTAMHERIAKYSYAAEVSANDEEDRAVRRALRERLIARAAADAG